MKRTVLILLIFLISYTVSAENLSFSSTKTQIVFAEGKERTRLSGNATVTTETSKITASEIELYGTDYRYALCKGSVSVDDSDKDLTLTSDRLFLDRQSNVTRAEGNAVMENRKDQLIIKGGFIENREEENITLIQVGVRILKEDMVARSEFARYREEEKILELSGMPQVYWKGDEYRATRIIINIETDEIELQGEVSGSLKNTGESETGESGNTVPESVETVQPAAVEEEASE